MALLAIATGISSCSDNDKVETPAPNPDPVNSTILVYAVATNSLSGNLVSDKNEMLLAAPYIDLDNNNVLIFETKYQYVEQTNSYIGAVNLLKLVKNEDKYEWKVEKEYSPEIASLNPERISEVINYVTENYKAENYGLIFWSHSTGAQPFVPQRTMSLPMAFSFGQDKTTLEAEYEQINVDELADAVPDGVFDFIWFDSCYMSNIESIYQFRGKCNTYIGYPTEVLEYGLPYDIVLPKLVGSTPDIEGAADKFFKYYAESQYFSLRIATIAAIDMKKINSLADFCKDYYKPGVEVDYAPFIKYTRYTTGPFYDLGDYTKQMAREQEMEIDPEDWSTVLDECVIYKAATPYDFAGRPIYPERYSGISTHVYSFGEESDSEKFYRGLAWYGDAFNLD